jgi:ankyrin repeat protein
MSLHTKLARFRQLLQSNSESLSSEHGWRCIAYACTTASGGTEQCKAAYTACYQSAAFDAPNAFGETCLHIAARSNNTAAIAWLLHPTVTPPTTLSMASHKVQIAMQCVHSKGVM